ncbi:MAG: hypothetical protein RBU21_02890 [FCB group bacterium]|nr:hypothetical protein [FCB group bacterium]
MSEVQQTMNTAPPGTKEYEMHRTIDRIAAAHDEAMRAIHRANEAFGNDAEFPVLLARLQEAGASLREAKNQAIRIKSRVDANAEESAQRDVVAAAGDLGVME